MKRLSDVIIIGGGPAGLSAALWCRDLGLDAILFERSDDLGGQLLWIHGRIENYLGLTVANGRELRDQFVEHLSAREIVPIKTSPVTSIDVVRKTVTLENGEKYAAGAVVIATGVRRRSLSVPGEQEFLGKGILSSGAASKKDVGGQKIVIVGGGDAAIENSVILSEFAEKVTVVHRRSEFRARPALLDAAEKIANIEFILDTEVAAVLGDDKVTSVEITSVRDRGGRTIPADSVLIRIGVQPNTEILNGQLELDADGYVRVGSSGASSVPAIFAVGDVANPVSPTISTAVGGGATAAKSVSALIKTSLNQ